MTEYAHGTHARYVINKCRCDECRKANREYEAKRRRWAREFPYVDPPLVDGTSAREHLESLLAQGVGERYLAAQAGLDVKTIRQLRGKRKDRDNKTGKIRRETRDAILSLELVYSKGHRVDRAEADAIVAELVARGWAKAAIGRRVHDNPQAHALQMGRGPMVSIGHLQTLRRLLTEAVPDPLPGDQRTRGTIKRQNGRRRRRVEPVTPGLEVPQDRATTAELIEDLLRDGEWRTMLSIVFECAELNRNYETIKRTVYRMVNDGLLERRLTRLKGGQEMEYRLPA